MVVVRCLRQDRVSSCVTTFVINHLGARFVEPPVLDMKAVSFFRPQNHNLLPVSSVVAGSTSWCLYWCCFQFPVMLWFCSSSGPSGLVGFNLE